MADKIDLTAEERYEWMEHLRSELFDTGIYDGELLSTASNAAFVATRPRKEWKERGFPAPVTSMRKSWLTFMDYSNNCFHGELNEFQVELIASIDRSVRR